MEFRIFERVEPGREREFFRDKKEQINDYNKQILHTQADELNENINHFFNYNVFFISIKVAFTNETDPENDFEKTYFTF